MNTNCITYTSSISNATTTLKPSYSVVRLDSGNACVNIAGMPRPSTENSSMLEVMFIECILNFCILCLMPPASMDIPRTSRMLPITEPASEAFTTSNRPSFMATKAMMSSVAFPNVAFRRPPIFCPAKQAMSSVALPITPASGIIASELNTKSSGSEKPAITGMNTRSMLRYFISYPPLVLHRFFRSAV